MVIDTSFKHKQKTRRAMSNFTKNLTSASPSRIPAQAYPVMHGVLRIGAGFLFFEHGAQKLFGLLGGMDGSGATASLDSLLGLAGILEFFGGGLLMAGLLTRPVALVLTGEMLVAFFKVHVPRGGFPIQNGGELALLYATVFAFLAVTGAGAWSLDRLLLRMKARRGSALDNGPSTT